MTAPPATTSGTKSAQAALPLWRKLIYGSGDLGMATFGTLRQLFYAIFLTDVVGLEPRLASVAALVGIIWDAINDPLVGALSDRVNTRWGRRRPFLLIFAIPYGLGFLLLWWAPPWQSQALLALWVTLAYMLSDTLQTLVVVPFLTLTPSIATDYDERTSLTGFRMFFNLVASLVTAVAAPMVIDATLNAGSTMQQGYLTVAALFGGLAALPFLAIFAFVPEQPDENQAHRNATFRETVHTAWQNVPFRFATLLYMLNWIAFDLVGLMLPFFVTYWVASGNLVQAVNVAGMSVSLESVVLGLLLITAVVSLPLWTWLAKRLSKRIAYVIGMAFWAVVQLLIIFIQPGELTLMLVLSVAAGLSVSTAHVLPDAIFPDVIEWDELRTGERHEGIYYGVKNFIRKATGALAIFVALQVLGWLGYQAPPADVTQFAQPQNVQLGIRILTGPVGAVMLLSAIAVAWFYPLTRERHRRIVSLLERRRKRRGATALADQRP